MDTWDCSISEYIKKLNYSSIMKNLSKPSISSQANWPSWVAEAPKSVSGTYDQPNISSPPATTRKQSLVCTSWMKVLVSWQLPSIATSKSTNQTTSNSPIRTNSPLPSTASTSLRTTNTSSWPSKQVNSSLNHVTQKQTSKLMMKRKQKLKIRSLNGLIIINRNSSHTTISISTEASTKSPKPSISNSNNIKTRNSVSTTPSWRNFSTKSKHTSTQSPDDFPRQKEHDDFPKSSGLVHTKRLSATHSRLPHSSTSHDTQD